MKSWKIVFRVLWNSYRQSSSIIRSEQIIEKLIEVVGMNNFEAFWSVPAKPEQVPADDIMLWPNCCLTVRVHKEEDALITKMLFSEEIISVEEL